MFGQVAATDAGLTYQGLISVPGWTTTGSTAESVDLASFNPVTQILYYADHVAHAVYGHRHKDEWLSGVGPRSKLHGFVPEWRAGNSRLAAPSGDGPWDEGLHLRLEAA
jgi:hypothetical protein